MDNQNQTTNQPSLGSKVKSNKTPILIIILALLTGVLLTVALAPKSHGPSGNNTSTNPTPFAPAEAVLSFGNSTSVGNVDSVDVVADTGKGVTTAIQLEMSFDPNMISNIQETQGDFVKGWQTLPSNNIDYKNGRISYTVAVPLGSSGVKGKGTVLHLSFTEIGTKGQTINITLLPKTMVSIQGYAGSSLKSSANFTKVIGQ